VRLSAYILGGLPFVVIAALLVASPSYLLILVHDPRGKIILIIAGSMLLLAFATMRQMMRSVLKP
jgi:tight adherence protein B